MTIAGFVALSKAQVEAMPRDVLIILILILSASASFGLGVLAGRDMDAGLPAGRQGSGFSISQIPLSATPASAAATPPAPASIPAGGQVVASKNGAKYFLPWCGGAKLISAANKITFANKEEAEAKGYQPATNCKGL